MSWLMDFRSKFECAMEGFRAIEQKRELCPAGSPEAEVSYETSVKLRVILRKMIDDTMAVPVNAANASDRWAIVQIAVEAFGVMDADVGRLAIAFGSEATPAGCPRSAGTE